MQLFFIIQITSALYLKQPEYHYFQQKTKRNAMASRMETSNLCPRLIFLSAYENYSIISIFYAFLASRSESFNNPHFQSQFNYSQLRFLASIEFNLFYFHCKEQEIAFFAYLVSGFLKLFQFQLIMIQTLKHLKEQAFHHHHQANQAYHSIHHHVGCFHFLLQIHFATYHC